LISRNTCQTQSLRKLLDDSLSAFEQERLTLHLDDCAQCRESLEKLTADGQWWNDTKESLASWAELATVSPDQDGRTGSIHSHVTDNQNADHQTKTLKDRSAAGTSSATASATAASHWVGSLLEKSDREGVLGVLDGVTILDVIGQGGMGVVLRGKDEQLHRPLAIKLLSPMLASNGAARQRFFREAQSAASIVHPNIVPIYAVSIDGVIPYIVMPLIGGGSLEQRLSKEGPLPIAQVLSFGLQVAEGLVAAHQQGIVHRDIKPANLLLDEGGFRVMLTDFGLARALDDATLTASGMVAGTPQYMSPEQATGRNIDHRTDIYSLGAVLYALATGHPPITGSSTLDVLRKLAEQSPRPIAEWNETYPSWFQRLIDKLMARDLDSRIATASEAAELLRGCLAHVRSPQKNELPSSLRSKKRIRRSLVLIASLVCIALGAFAWQATSTGTTKPFQPVIGQNQLPPFNLSSPQSLRSDEWNNSSFQQAITALEIKLQGLKNEIENEH